MLVWVRETRSRRFFYCVSSVALMVTLFLYGSSTRGEESVGLFAEISEIVRLGPDRLSEYVILPIDCVGGRNILIQATSSHAGLNAWLEGPSGQIIDESSISTYGGEFMRLDDNEPADGQFNVPFEAGGLHMLWAVPSLGVGDYKVHLEMVGPLDEHVAIIVEAILDSDVRTNLLATTSRNTINSAIVVAVPLFDAETPVAGATVTLYVKPSGSGEFVIPLFDNGPQDGGPDSLSADGLYTGFFVPSDAGDYRLVAEIEGVTSGGVPFLRVVGSRLVIVEQCGIIGEISDRVEAGGSRLIIEAEVDVILPGDFILQAILETASGIPLLAYGASTLGTGLQTMAAYVDSERIRASLEDGPLRIKQVDLFCVGADGAMPSGHILSDSMETGAYSWRQFRAAPIELSGHLRDEAVDLAPVGDYDKLRVWVGVRVLREGTYRYEAILKDSCGATIQTKSGITYLGPSTALPPLDFMELMIEFGGATIGQHGLDGPYSLDYLYLNGPLEYPATHSLIAEQVGVVDDDDYEASEFVSYTAFLNCNSNNLADSCDLQSGVSADCNLNDVPDECEVGASGAENDCNGNFVPDDCEPDCNHNGMADECDVTASTSSDCNLNRIPDECEIEYCFGFAECGDCNANAIPDGCETTQLSATPKQSLMASPPVDQRGFGQSMAIAGSTIVIGAASSWATAEKGCADIFEKTGDSWSRVISLKSNVTGTPSTMFGKAVAMDADRIIVGAPSENNGKGAAYIFKKSNGQWTETEEQKIVGVNSNTEDNFGWSVAISDDVVVIGCPNDDAGGVNSGSVYVFRRAGAIWTQEAKLSSSDIHAGDLFGHAVSLSGNTLLVGAVGDSYPSLSSHTGSAYVFEYNGTTWMQKTKLESQELESNQGFGCAVATDGFRFVIGASGTSTNGSSAAGAAYVFLRQQNLWPIERKLNRFSPDSWDEFGTSVALDGNRLLVGARQASTSGGLGVLFQLSQGGWIQDAEILPPNSAGANLYGTSTALSDDWIGIGGPSANVGAPFSGRAYLYKINDRDCDDNGVLDTCDGNFVEPPSGDPSGYCAMGSQPCVVGEACANGSTCLPYNKAKFISFIPVPPTSQGLHAIGVNLTSLHRVSPPYTDGGSMPFYAYEGETRWLGPPIQFVESNASGIPFFASFLQCEPYYHDWSTIGLVHVTGAEITPSSQYEVRAYGSACQGSEANCCAVSSAVSVSTARWGDVEVPFAPPATATQPDLVDVSSIINKFRESPGAPIKARAILTGDMSGTPNIGLDLNFTHISACVDAFRGAPYQYPTCPCPIPPCVSCTPENSATTCGQSGVCVNNICSNLKDICGRCTTP